MNPGQQSYHSEAVALLRLCSEAALAARDEREFFRSLCNILVKSGLFQFAWFGYADESTRKIIKPLVHSEDGAGFLEEVEAALRQTDDEDCSNIAIESGEAYWIKDLRDHATRAPVPPTALERGYTSVLSLPVIWEYRSRGTLTLYYGDPDRFEIPTVKLLMEYLTYVKPIVTVRIPPQTVGSKGHEAELRSLIDALPYQISLLTPEGRIFCCNQAEVDFFGLPTERILSASHELQHPDDMVRSVAEFMDKFKSGLPFGIDRRMRRRDGQFRWFSNQYAPLRDEQGQIVRWCVVSTDIHDRKVAEERLQNENIALREEIDKASMSEEIVGTSGPLKEVLARVSMVAPTDSSVLITGETGTGKELVARAIHRRSRRSSHAFVSVNCAAIPRDLIASELFGHEKGAFTGATHRRLGRFELAEKGTIFLDEVGELPAETQIALLRVLQEREFERIGGTGSMRTDVRVIAATNRDLESAIESGKFRSDLFYRLNVFPVELPPLRKRSEDIPLLVTYFLNRYARKAGRHFTAIDKKSLELLQSYAWPGNIRELQNVIERSVIVSESQTFSVDESWLSRRPPASDVNFQSNLLSRLPAEEKALIEAALRECGGRVYGPSGAAERLGIPRTTLESKIKALNIKKNRFKGPDPLKES